MTEIKHISFIMDGNGRWAKRRGFPRSLGHQQGAKALSAVVEFLRKEGVPYCSFFAFSTENFKRPKEEVDGIFDIIRRYFANYLDEYAKNNIRIRFLGSKALFPDDIVEIMRDCESKTSSNNGMVVALAFGYGGRDDLVRAFDKMMSDGISDIDEATLSLYLDTKGIPDPDIIVRSGGETRLSNYFLFQSAYSELYFTEVLWPDFGEQEVKKVFLEYSRRQRNYGGRKND